MENQKKTASLDHGTHFHKKQEKVKRREPSAKKEGFRGSLENHEFTMQTEHVKEKTHELLNKNADIQNQVSKIQALESQYADLAKQYETVQANLMGITNSFIGQPGSYGNVYVDTVVNNPTATFQDVYNAGTDTMPLVSSSKMYSRDECLKTAVKKGDTYFGLQGATSNNNAGLCSTGSNLTSATKNGKATTSCAQGSDGYIYGSTLVNAVYQVPTSSYIGTFKDSPNRAVPLINGGSQTYSHASCQQAAIKGGYQIFALQNGSYNGGAQCGLTNDYNRAVAQGTTKNSFTANDGFVYGGGWANSLYQIQSTNGNYIGCFNDNAKNPAMNLANNQTNHTVATCQQAAINAGATYFGLQGGTAGSSKCYISNSLQSIKQYGDAVPYITGKDGYKYGSSGANAIYKVDQTNGNPADVGKIGYIDTNGLLNEYPSSMISGKTIKNGNPSCPTAVTSIDSIKWNTYKNSGHLMSPSSVCGLAKAKEQDNQELSAIKAQMNSIANQIVQSTNTLQSYNAELLTQMGVDKGSLASNLKKYAKVTDLVNKYTSYNLNNVNGMLSDTNTMVLQESYVYMGWTILAIAIAIITLTTIRK